ncbi:TylF/MycF/NovP-related O-methyltransferase [Crateriforma conspicua]|nr:TylF/MycF/NovP-related O-methyltransferase [Crateriforma conspicua]
MKKIILSFLNAIGKSRIETAPQPPTHLKEIVRSVIDQKITFLPENSINSLLHLMCEIEDHKIRGDVIEAGCALGGSGIALCAAKDKDRSLHLYDTFGMIPPPTDNDDSDVHERYEVIANGKAKGINGDRYYGYNEDNLPLVVESFNRFAMPVDECNVHFHKGLLQDTMVVPGPIALAHIDVDWYDPVYVSLERIVPKLEPGGAIVLDDYFAWSGCRKATDNFFRGRESEFSFDSDYGHMIVRRN